MSFLKLISRWIEKITENVGVAVSWLLLVMALVIIWDVLLRYLFKAGSVAVQDMEWYLFGINFLLGAAMNYNNDSNTRIDIFYNRYSKKTKAVIELLGHVIFLLPFLLAVIWWCYPFVSDSWATRERSLSPGGLPGIYLIKAVIPVAFILLLIGFIPNAVKNLFVIMGRKE